MDDEGRRRARWRWAWPVAALLAVVSFTGSLVIGGWLFPDLSLNNDEAVYVLEAQNYADGHLTLSDSLHGDAFRPWMSGRVGDDRLVLVEQPALPGLMALTDTVFGSMRVALGLIAAGAVLSIFAFARQLLGDDRVALVAAGCFVLSPLVLVQSAMFVSYVLAVALAASTLTLLTVALDRREADRPWARWVLGAGAVHGVLLVTRPLEAIVLGLVELAWLGLRRVGLRSAARAVGLLVVGAVPALLLGLLYNALTTGHPLRFALWTIGGDDSFGFGPRAVAEHAQYVDVGVSEAWLALRTNLRAFPHWTIGGLVGLPLAAWGAWTLWARRQRPQLALLAVMLVVYPFAYFFYYGNYLIIGGRNLYGPHYYLALLMPSMVLLGVGITALWNRRWAFAVVAVAVVAGTVIELPDKVDVNLRARDDIAAEIDAVEAAVEPPAVVIIPQGVDGPYVLHPRGALANPPDLDADVLYAADLGGRNVELFDRFPDRTLYRLQTVEGPDGTGPDVVPLRLATGPSVSFRVDAGSDASDPADDGAVATIGVGDRSAPCQQADGSDPVELTLTPDRLVATGCDQPVDLPVPDGPGTVTVGVDGPGSEAPVEARWWFRAEPDEVEVIAPGDLWRVGEGRGPRVVAPDLVPWVTATVDDPR